MKPLLPPARARQPLALAALTALAAAFAAGATPARLSGSALMQAGVALGGPAGAGAALSAMLAQDASRGGPTTAA